MSFVENFRCALEMRRPYPVWLPGDINLRRTLWTMASTTNGTNASAEKVSGPEATFGKSIVTKNQFSSIKWIASNAWFTMCLLSKKCNSFEKNGSTSSTYWKMNLSAKHTHAASSHLSHATLIADWHFSKLARLALECIREKCWSLWERLRIFRLIYFIFICLHQETVCQKACWTSLNATMAFRSLWAIRIFWTPTKQCSSLWMASSRIALNTRPTSWSNRWVDFPMLFSHRSSATLQLFVSINHRSNCHISIAKQWLTFP